MKPARSHRVLLALALLLPLPHTMAQNPAPPDDPFLWLEEVQGDQALAWVRERNAESQKVLQARPEYEPTRARLLEILNSKERPSRGQILQMRRSPLLRAFAAGTSGSLAGRLFRAGPRFCSKTCGSDFCRSSEHRPDAAIRDRSKRTAERQVQSGTGFGQADLRSSDRCGGNADRKSVV